MEAVAKNLDVGQNPFLGEDVKFVQEKSDPESLNNEFSEMSRVAEATKPEISDANEPRFGVSLLFDIGLGNENPFNKFGDYKNLSELPRVTLIPFFSISVPIPPQAMSSVVYGDDYESIVGQFVGAFDENAYNQALTGNVMRNSYKTASVCADLFMSKYAGAGSAVFGCDILMDLQNLDYKEANRIFSTVLPVFDRAIFPETVRLVLGYEVKGPFLDEIKSWLERPDGSMQHILESDLSEDFKVKARNIRQRLSGLTNTTISRAKSAIAKKNDLIQRGEVGDYDQPNFDLVGAPKPPDLIMLAHTKTAPIQERDQQMAADHAEAARLNAMIPTGQNQGVDVAALVAEVRRQVLEEVGLSASAPSIIPVAPTVKEIDDLEGIE